MTSSLRYAAVALCVALAFTACTKSTQSTSTDATQTTAPDVTAAGASAAPDATSTAAGEATTATNAPAASATTSAMNATTAPPTTTGTTTTGTTTTGTTTAGGSANGTPGTYIDLPVYPGATENKDQDMSVSANGGSLVVQGYTTKDDTKAVADWYKSHLPATWKGGVMTAGSKSVGSFANEMSDGVQSVLVVTQDDGSTRILLTTKHGK
jgi:hypothetical protein